MEDLITVIVPVFNVENYLERCIKSILNQTYRKLEIILVDDGSTDGSGKLCDKYELTYPRVKVIHKNNAGLGFARNTGLEIAKGKYVVFVDSDDYIGENRIMSMYDNVIKSNADTCLTGFTKTYNSFFVEHRNILAGKQLSDGIIENILPRMCGADKNGVDQLGMSSCMIMYSLEIIKAKNLLFKSERELISEDLIFNFEYFPFSRKVIFLESTDYFYCDNQGTLTTKYRADRFQSQVKLYNKVLELAENHGITKICKPRLDSTLVAIARYSIKLEYKFILENGCQNVRQNVKNICNNTTLYIVLINYDDSGIRKGSQIINSFIKKHMYFFLFLTMMLKNFLNI